MHDMNDYGYFVILPNAILDLISSHGFRGYHAAYNVQLVE